LEKRPSAADVKDIVQSPTKAAAKKLEYAQAGDTVAQGLRRRGSKNDMKARGILKTQNEQKQVDLEHAMAATKLNRFFKKTLAQRAANERPAAEALGYAKAPHQAASESLERSMAADVVHRTLRNTATAVAGGGVERATEAENLKARGLLLEPKEAAAQSLERSMAKDTLKKHIGKEAERLDAEEPHPAEDFAKTEQDIAKADLERNIAADKLQKFFRKINSEHGGSQEKKTRSLSVTGVLKTPQEAAAEKLERAQAGDKIHQYLREKPEPPAEVVEAVEAAVEAAAAAEEG